MRLDKFLKVSRIIKRRTVANEACDQGRISLDGKVAKASTQVSPGSIIEVKIGERLNRYEILSVAEHVAKGDVGDLYRPLP